MMFDALVMGEVEYRMSLDPDMVISVAERVLDEEILELRYPEPDVPVRFTGIDEFCMSSKGDFTLDEQYYIMKYIVQPILDNPAGFEEADCYTIHDCVYSLPADCSQAVTHYKCVLAQLCDSDSVNYVLSQLGAPCLKPEDFGDLTGDDIMNSTYALC